MFASAAIDQIEERQVSRAENKLFTLLQLLLTACYCRTEREKNEQRKSQNTNPLKGQGKIGSRLDHVLLLACGNQNRPARL